MLRDPAGRGVPLLAREACVGGGLLQGVAGLPRRGHRVVRAPGFSDRVLALDTMTINMIALITLFGIQRGTSFYFEATMLFAMVGFVSTVAFAKFILRGNIIE